MADEETKNSDKGKIRIAFFDAKEYDEKTFTLANEKYDYDIRFFNMKLTTDTVKLAKKCDAVCVFVNDVIDKSIIDALVKRKVKLIALRCAGYNNVDLDYAYGKITVVRVPAYSPYAIAEHAMALLLTSIRRIHKAYIRTRDFNFNLTGLMGFDLHGKTAGIIGTGKIGRVFADICKGFGMNVLAYDKFPVPDSGLNYVSLDEIWGKSDVISLHCPLTDETKYLINTPSIAKMKDKAVIINTSRGALINSRALLEGLKSRKIGAACLDVYEEEADLFYNDMSGHIVDDDILARLISFPNVIVTSHQAFLTKDALDNIAKTTLENVATVCAGQKCENEVCYKCK